MSRKPEPAENKESLEVKGEVKVSPDEITKKLAKIDFQVNQNINEFYQTEVSLQRSVEMAVKGFDLVKHQIPANSRKQLEAFMKPYQELAQMGYLAEAQKLEGNDTQSRLNQMLASLQGPYIEKRIELFREITMNYDSELIKKIPQFKQRDVDPTYRQDEEKGRELMLSPSGLLSQPFQRTPRYVLQLEAIQGVLVKEKELKGEDPVLLAAVRSEAGRIKSYAKKTDAMQNDMKMRAEITALKQDLHDKLKALESDRDGLHAKLSSTFKDNTENKIKAMKTLIQGIDISGKDMNSIMTYLALAKQENDLTGSRGYKHSGTEQLLDKHIQIIKNEFSKNLAVDEKGLENQSLLAHHAEKLKSAIKEMAGPSKFAEQDITIQKVEQIEPLFVQHGSEENPVAKQVNELKTEKIEEEKLIVTEEIIEEVMEVEEIEEEFVDELDEEAIIKMIEDQQEALAQEEEDEDLALMEQNAGILRSIHHVTFEVDPVSELKVEVIEQFAQPEAEIEQDNRKQINL